MGEHVFIGINEFVLTRIRVRSGPIVLSYSFSPPVTQVPRSAGTHALLGSRAQRPAHGIVGSQLRGLPPWPGTREAWGEVLRHRIRVE